MLTLAAAGCVVAGEAYDVSDPQTLLDLGVPEVTDHGWERVAGDTTIKGTTPRAVPAEIDRIAAALADVPDALLAKVRLRDLIRAPDIDSGGLHPATQAFARGPDIYLIDRTFSEAGMDRWGLAEVLAHELAHVGQFDRLEAAYIESIIDGERTLVVEGSSELVEDFAGAVGWRSSGSPATWSLSDPSRTTAYGATSPHEDMAESVAMVATGRADWISSDRVQWVENWLDAPAESLAQGMPWVPPGAESLRSSDPVYDQTAVGRVNAAHVEPRYWLLPTASAAGADLATDVDLQLRRRGFAGTMERIQDGRVPRWGGTYLRSDGVHLRAELWDFRDQTGFSSAPDGPLLSYVMLW